MFRVGRRCPVVPIWELEPIPRPAFVLAGRFPPLEPSPKRLLRLTRSTTRQKTLHADVFIQTWPVDPLATGNETPVGPLRRCPVRQTREPRKWHGDRPAIRKFRDQSIVAHTYALGQCFLEFSPRSTHAMTSTKRPRFPRPVFRYVQFPPGRSRGCSPGGLVPARTSPFRLPARHARGEAHLDPPSKRTAGMAPREERLATYPSVHGQYADWCRSFNVPAHSIRPLGSPIASGNTAGLRSADRGHERQRESVHRPLTQRQCRGAGLSRISSQGSCPLHQEPGDGDRRAGDSGDDAQHREHLLARNEVQRAEHQSDLQ